MMLAAVDAGLAGHAGELVPNSGPVRWHIIAARKLSRQATRSDVSLGQAIMVKIGMPLGLSEVMSGLLGRQFGTEALESGDYRGAAAHLSNAVRVVQDAREKAETQTILGYCELKLRNYDRAQAILLEAARALPDEGDFNSVIPSLMALKHGGELPEDAHEELERTYQIVIALGHPECVPRALLNLGAIEYNVKGRPDAARGLWERAYRKSLAGATMARIAYNLGWYWEHEGDPSRAQRYYQEARMGWPKGEKVPDRLSQL